MQGQPFCSQPVFLPVLCGYVLRNPLNHSPLQEKSLFLSEKPFLHTFALLCRAVFNISASHQEQKGCEGCESCARVFLLQMLRMLRMLR